MAFPVHVIRIIFDFVPHETWCLNRFHASTIIKVGKQWEQLSHNFQCIIWKCTYSINPKHEHFFKEATQILREALNLCTIHFHCHGLIACHLMEQSIYLDSYYNPHPKKGQIKVYCKSLGPRTIDISTYLQLQKDLETYLMKKSNLCGMSVFWIE